MIEVSKRLEKIKMKQKNKININKIKNNSTFFYQKKEKFQLFLSLTFPRLQKLIYLQNK